MAERQYGQILDRLEAQYSEYMGAELRDRNACI